MHLTIIGGLYNDETLCKPKKKKVFADIYKKKKGFGFATNTDALISQSPIGLVQSHADPPFKCRT